MRTKIFIIFLLQISFGSIAQPNFKLVKDLKQNLIVFDEQEEVYVPFLEELHFKANTISFKFDKKHFSSCFLEISVSDPISIFVDGRLSYNFDKGSSRIEIGKIFGNDNSLYTIYGLKNASSLNEIKIVYPSSLTMSSSMTRNLIELKKVDPFLNVIIMTFVLILFGYTFIRITKPKIYTWYFDITKLINNTSTDTNVIVSSFNGPVFFLLAINSTVLSFCINLYNYRNYSMDPILADNIAYHFIFNLLLVGLIIYVGFILKFILLRFIGGLIGIQGLSKLHYFEFNRLITLISCVGLPLSLIAFYSESNLDKFTRFVYIFLFLIATLRIILVVNRESTFRIIYLFSYICTTEIVPILILAKYFGFEHL